jgi:hypothetical protein
MCFFFLGHEMGHFLDGHFRGGATYPTWREEFEADLWACRLHSEFVRKTVNPSHLEFAASKAFEGAACALGVWSLFDEFARHAGETWQETHPAAAERYQRYRGYAPQLFGVTSSFFDDYAAWGTAPSLRHRWLEVIKTRLRAIGLAELAEVDTEWSWARIASSASVGQDLVSDRFLRAISKLQRLGAREVAEPIEAEVRLDFGDALEQRGNHVGALREYTAAYMLAARALAIDDSETQELERLRAESAAAAANVLAAMTRENAAQQEDCVLRAAHAVRHWSTLVSSGHIWPLLKVAELAALLHARASLIDSETLTIVRSALTAITHASAPWGEDFDAAQAQASDQIRGIALALGS